MNPSIPVLLANADKLWARTVTRCAPSDSPELVRDCLLWTSTLDKDRYGIFQFRHEGVKYQKPAHIASFVIAKKREPRQILRHRCNRRACIEPSHLLPGSHQQNMDDMVMAGRSAKGSANARSKLVESDVVAVLRLLSKGVPRSLIAETLGVDRSTVGGIADGTLWRHVPRPW